MYRFYIYVVVIKVFFNTKNLEASHIITIFAQNIRCNIIYKTMYNKIINEMAVERGDFFQYGMNQSATVLQHIGKICVFENDIKMNHWVKHWEDEIAAQLYDIGKIDVKKDNKNSKIKKKAFMQSFIEARLGKDLCEYDDKMCSYIIDGLEEEGMSEEQIRKIDIKQIAQINKERIKNYLYSFVELMSIKDLNVLKEECKKAAYNF